MIYRRCRIGKKRCAIIFSKKAGGHNRHVKASGKDKPELFMKEPFNRKRHQNTWRAQEARLPARRKVAMCKSNAEKDHKHQGQVF